MCALFNLKKILLCLLLLVTACGAPPADNAALTSSPVVVTIHATAAAQAWQSELFDCAAKHAVVLVLSDPGSADISLRVGEPQNLSLPAFQLGSEEILVVVNPARSSMQLQAEQVVQLFTGEINDWSQVTSTSSGVQNAGTQGGAVQVWLFSDGEDVQQVFATWLAGRSVVSGARLAASPQAMVRAIADDPNAVGILSRHWKTENVSDVYVAASAPVLAVTPSEPQGIVKDLLACLQG